MTVSPLFRGLVAALDLARKTSSKKDKVAILAGYLAPLSPADAEVAASIATGRTSKKGSRLEAQVGYSTLISALKEVSGASGREVSDSYLRHGDLGTVAEELLQRKVAQTLFDEPLTLRSLWEDFDRLRNLKGKGSADQRASIARSMLTRASPSEAKYVVKVLTGEMRTGIVSGLMEEAISTAFSLPKDEVARAHMLLGDVGLLAREAASGTLTKVKMTPFQPVNFMLAESAPTAKEAAETFGRPVYADCKYDGVRAQVHKRGSVVKIYSRRLEEITESFPEVASRLQAAKSDFIVDGEIVPFRDGKPLPFQLLQRRLRRKEDFEGAAEAAPVEFFAFDILLSGANEVSALPLSERRQLLSKAIKGTGALMAQSETVDGADEIDRAFRRSREGGYEGLVLKDPASQYSMGKRGAAWMKLKEELETVDAVVVAAEYGHGKRAGVISDYTFAVWDGDRLKVVGKAYSGLTDAEIAEMTERMKKTTVKDYGYRRTVRPEVVLEVAFDSIQRSTRHDSGFALRFPRIKRIREDRAPGDADTLDKVARIFSSQRVKLDER